MRPCPLPPPNKCWRSLLDVMWDKRNKGFNYEEVHKENFNLYYEICRWSFSPTPFNSLKLLTGNLRNSQSLGFLTPFQCSLGMSYLWWITARRSLSLRWREANFLVKFLKSSFIFLSWSVRVLKVLAERPSANFFSKLNENKWIIMLIHNWCPKKIKLFKNSIEYGRCNQ